MTMSIPSTDAMASALAIASGVSSITATVVWASKKSSSSRCGMGWNRLAGFGPETERWPRGGNRHASAMRSASSAVLDVRDDDAHRADVERPGEVLVVVRGTRTSGVMPAPIAAEHSSDVVSSEVAVCSRSTYTASYPAAAASHGMSAVRAWVRAMQSTSCPSSIRAQRGHALHHGRSAPAGTLMPRRAYLKISASRSSPGARPA